MKADTKKDFDMSPRVFLGLVGMWPGVKEDSEMYLGRADKSFKGATTEYINIGRAWHSSDEIPGDIDQCLLDLGDSEYNIGRIFTNGNGEYLWQTDFACRPTNAVLRWAYLKDLMPSKR